MAGELVSGVAERVARPDSIASAASAGASVGRPREDLELFLEPTIEGEIEEPLGVLFGHHLEERIDLASTGRSRSKSEQSE